MVFIAPFFGAVALLSGLVSALPRPQDSAVGEEVAVSAPNGIPLTDSVELSSQLASETGAAQKAQPTETAANYGGGYGGAYGAASSVNEWTSEAVATSTSAAWPAYSSPAYGSGQSNWGGSGYEDCVSQCLAKYGSPAAPYTPTTTSGSEGSEGSSGNGATHTVIVAPSQGVLRYVPFAVNASVGDTIKFMWGANNHTVTKSSALQPCNKSSDALFASGIKSKDFVFTQVVNDTNPVYFHCAIPTHCQKGMFGIINPPNSFGSASSVSAMMQSLGASNPDVATYASYTSKQTGSNLQASKWGGNIDLSALPDWAHADVAENVLYTRNFLASNTEVLKEDGSIDLGSAGSTPLMIPQDVGAALNNAAAASTGTSGSTSPSVATSETPAPTGETENQVQGNGASSLASPRAFVALFVVVATFFSL
jgi:plastocyanin